MKSLSLRPQVAALAVLAAAGALFAAKPAAAQHAYVYAAPAIVAPAPPAWHGPARRDHRPPRIMEVTPEHGDRVMERGETTRITARVHDGGSGIADVRLRIDGRDVSHRVRFNGDHVRYRENFSPGWHTAELVVRDRAGNVSRKSWTFAVIEPYRHYGAYGTHGGFNGGYDGSYRDYGYQGR